MKLICSGAGNRGGAGGNYQQQRNHEYNRDGGYTRGQSNYNRGGRR